MDGISYEGGRYEAMFAGDINDIWHRKGQAVGRDHLKEEEVRNTIQVPIIKVSNPRFTIPVSGGTDTVEIISEVSHITYRLDTMRELAAVGSDYTVVPYEEHLVNPFLPFVESGVATFDTCGLLFGGRQGFVGVKWNHGRMSALVQEALHGITSHALGFASMDGSSKNWFAQTNVRPVCRNTVYAGLSSAMEKLAVTHKRNARENTVKVAAEVFKDIIRHHEEIALAFASLKSRLLTKSEFQEAVVDIAAPKPTNIDGPRASVVLKRWEDKVKEIRVLWTNGDGHIGDGSAWEAYNGLIQSLDHNTDMWKAQSDDNRTMSLTSGKLAQIRESVFNKLLALAS